MAVFNRWIVVLSKIENVCRFIHRTTAIKWLTINHAGEVAFLNMVKSVCGVTAWFLQPKTFKGLVSVWLKQQDVRSADPCIFSSCEAHIDVDTIGLQTKLRRIGCLIRCIVVATKTAILLSTVTLVITTGYTKT